MDDAFFYRYTLDHLKEREYPNDGPDLIFDPKDFEDTGVWKRTAWDKVETVEPVTSINVPVTALDFGAYGRLKAVATPRCGPGKPVKVRVGGQERQFVTIPMDEDGNLIADRMDKPNNGMTPWGYKGDPGRDDDQIPKGNGIQGDGFTAFEEYRGFIRSDGHCGDPKQDVHFRTDPTKKDLFIAPESADLAEIARKFGDATGLGVHLICPRHYNNKRVVNFTLQDSRSREWQGKTISQAEPQHGISLAVEGLMEAAALGPPKYLTGSVGGDPLLLDALVSTLVTVFGHERGLVKKLVYENHYLHQLGHAIGIRHHGQEPLNDVVILDVPFCPQETKEGTVNGKRACGVWGSSIAVRGGATSGNQDCPMKLYFVPYWYVPPGSSLMPAGEVRFQYKASDGTTAEDRYPGYRGRLKKYEKNLDRPGVDKFCTSRTGTGINALPGDENHAGDSTRVCGEQICVNDVRCQRPTP